MSEQLLHLYNSILVPIFSEWIADDDLCCLDTSVCNFELRPSVLAILRHCRTISRDIQSKQTEEKYEWMLYRGIKLRSLVLNDPESNIISSSLKELLALSKRLEYLYVGNYDFLSDFSDMNLSVDKLQCRFARDAEMESVLKAVTVFDLDISACNNLSWNFYNKIPELCPCLRGISLPSCANAGFLVDILGLQRIKHSVSWSSEFGNWLEWRQTKGNEKASLEFNGMNYICTALELEDPDESIVRTTSLQYLQSLMITASFSVNRHIFMPSKAFLQDVATSCRSLTSLSFERVKLEESDLVAIIEQSKYLRKFHFYDKVVTDVTIRALTQHCRFLEDLKCSPKGISDSALIKLVDDCHFLSLIDPSFYALPSAVLYHLASKHDVLEISDNPISTCIYRKQFHLGYKLILQLGNSYAFEKNIDMIKLLTENVNLRKLKDCGLSDYSYNWYHIAQICPYLSEISVDGSKFKLLEFVNVKSLTALTIKQMTGVTTEEVREFLRETSLSLVKLALPECDRLYSDILVSIADYCPDLRYLDLSECFHCNTDDLTILLERCQKLWYLDLRKCSVDVEYFTMLFQQRRMRYVNIEGDGDGDGDSDEDGAEGYDGGVIVEDEE